MNKKEIDHYINTVYITYDKSVQERYGQWLNSGGPETFDKWAEIYHPQWYALFGLRNE